MSINVFLGSYCLSSSLWRKSSFVLIQPSMSLKNVSSYSSLRWLGITLIVFHNHRITSFPLASVIPSIMKMFRNRLLWLFTWLPNIAHRVRVDLFFCQSLLQGLPACIASMWTLTRFWIEQDLCLFDLPAS